MTGYERLPDFDADAFAPDFLERVNERVELLLRLKPWTLVELPKEGLWVAKRRNPWMRLRTIWLNRSRRIEARRARVAFAAYFSPEAIAARRRLAG